MKEFKESDDFKQMVQSNTWHSHEELLSNVQQLYDLIKSWPKWTWGNNMDCKYINIRIDMRDGGHIISNKEGRCSLDAIKWQWSDE